MKKFISTICIIVLIWCFSFVSFAAVECTLEKKKDGETKCYVFENCQGTCSNKIARIEQTTNKIEGAIEFKNNSDPNYTGKENTEILILVPEEFSKIDEDGQYADSIKELCNKILQKDNKTKIGIIGITGSIKDTTISGGKVIRGPRDQVSLVGSASNAEVVVGLTNNLDTIKNGYDAMNPEKLEYRENLQAAMKLANSTFSSNNVNKIVISLFDDVPVISIGTNAVVSTASGGSVKDSIAAHNQQMVDHTVDEIKRLQDSGVSFIFLRPNDNSYDQTWSDSETGEITEFDGKEYVRQLYGTLEEPRFGKLYSLEKSTIEKVVVQDIYDDIVKEYERALKNFKIECTFAPEIRKAFNISVYVVVNAKVDESKLESEGKVTITAANLNKDDTLTFTYDLRLKKDVDESLFNKELTVNSVDVSSSLNSKVSIDSPSVMIKTGNQQPENKPENKPTNRPINNPVNGTQNKVKADNTVAPQKYPFTGKTMLVVFFVTLIISVVFGSKKMVDLKDVK